MDFYRRRFLLTLLLFIAASAGSSAEERRPLQVYLLVGQSNMQGHAHVRTFPHIGMDPKTAPLLDQIQNAEGKPRVCEDVWISYLSAGGVKQGRLTAGFGASDEKIGPELTFGIRMHEIVGEPILIIKTAWGGKSLNTDFRPPSAGPYRFNETQLEAFQKQGKNLDEIKAAKAEATGKYYRMMLDHVKSVLADISKVYPDYDSKQGYQLAGFVWFQGWNDMVDRGTYPNRGEKGGYDQYSEVMAHFIRDVRKDLSAPHLPFVIGVMGAGGPVDKYLPGQQRYAGIHQNFRMAMAAPANMDEFQYNTAAVFTENYWDMELVMLRDRDAKINQAVKKIQSEGKLKKDEVRATQEKMRAEQFTERELKVLTTAVSNAEYHYLGSSKIMAQIGVGFAEALGKLRGK